MGDIDKLDQKNSKSKYVENIEFLKFKRNITRYYLSFKFYSDSKNTGRPWNTIARIIIILTNLDHIIDMHFVKKNQGNKVVVVIQGYISFVLKSFINYKYNII